MRYLLVVATCFLALAHNAHSTVTCKYGWTQSESEDVENWSGECDLNDPDAKCATASCEADGAQCFKAKFTGDDGFIDFYGCVDDVDGPSDENSTIPANYNVDTLQLKYLPDDDCATSEHEIFKALPAGATDLGLNVHAEWCACADDGCNAAGGIAAIAGLTLAGTVLARFV